MKVVKALYKDLVCVAKDPDTQEIKCHSLVFRIDSLEGSGSLYASSNKEHPQNATYILVDPINSHATLLQNNW